MDIRKMTAEVTGNHGAEYTVEVKLLGQNVGEPARYEASVVLNGDPGAYEADKTIYRWTLEAAGHVEALNLALGWVP